MPFANYLFCERCGPPVRVDINFIATINSYVQDGRMGAMIDERVLIWDYLVYSCEQCRAEYRYTFRDVEQRVREYFAHFVESQREYLLAVIDAQGEEEDRRLGTFFTDSQERTRRRLKDMYER